MILLFIALSHLVCPSFDVHLIRCETFAEGKPGALCFEGLLNGNWYHVELEPEQVTPDELGRYEDTKRVHCVRHCGIADD